MFTATIISFLLSSLSSGTQVAEFIVFIRKALILDIDYRLPEKLESANNALQPVYTLANWAEYLPVSVKLSAINAYLFMFGGGIA